MIQHYRARTLVKFNFEDKRIASAVIGMRTVNDVAEDIGAALENPSKSALPYPPKTKVPEGCRQTRWWWD
jgi:hypothetical protein